MWKVVDDDNDDDDEDGDDDDDDDDEDGDDDDDDDDDEDDDVSDYEIKITRLKLLEMHHWNNLRVFSYDESLSIVPSLSID